jgi:hypothetical protein
LPKPNKTAKPNVRNDFQLLGHSTPPNFAALKPAQDLRHWAFFLAPILLSILPNGPTKSGRAELVNTHTGDAQCQQNPFA